MLYVRKGIYWVKFQHRGEPVRESTKVRVDGPDSKRLASEAETVIRAKHVLKSGSGGEGFASRVTLAALRGLDIQRARDAGHPEERVKTIRYQWKHLCKHLEGEHRDVASLTLAEVRKHETGRRAEGRPGQTIVRERQALVRGLKLAVESGLLPDWPFNPTMLRPIQRSPKNIKRKGVLHSREFIERILGRLSAKAVTAGHPQICRFVMETGLRASELQRAASFRVTETPWGAILHVRSAKETTERTEERDIPMRPEVFQLYKDWKHRFAHNDIDDALKLASSKAGVARGVTLRDLRKFFGSRVAKKSLPAAQKLLGHSSVATTSHYVDSLDQDVLDALVPGGGHTPGHTKKPRRQNPQ